MGLYLAIFDDLDEEIFGVEIGRYSDFGIFRETIEKEYGNVKAEKLFPNLILHSVSDGQWSPNECLALLKELNLLKSDFEKKPPIDFNGGWQNEIKIVKGLPNNNLYESFVDIDGEILIDRLIEIVEVSIIECKPILFQ